MRISRLFVLSALLFALTFGVGLAGASAQTGYGDDVADPKTLTIDPPSGEAASSGGDDDGMSTGVVVGLVLAGLVVLGGAAYGASKLRT